MIQKAALAAFCLLLGLISFWTLAPVGFRPQTGHGALERFLAFIALGGALGVGYPRRPMLTAAIVCGIAFGSEALQIIVPSRDAGAVDAVEKALGAIVGVGSVLAITDYLRLRVRAQR